MKLLIRWIIASLALFVVAWLVPGIHVEGNAWIVYAVMAVILGLVNAVMRPVLKFLTCPLIILTLGIFVLVINGLTLWLASVIAIRWFHVGFYVDGFRSAFLGALIVSVVTVILSALVKEEIRGSEVATEVERFLYKGSPFLPDFDSETFDKILNDLHSDPSYYPGEAIAKHLIYIGLLQATEVFGEIGKLKMTPQDVAQYTSGFSRPLRLLQIS
jgi:putative membrane protein